ncbi:MAG: preprotein translocase subunit SecG, partial [Candidatus Eisenbacteria bacterium]|nr:preprotein translocase subunit SecG [Candidatus Eisenbacteria bacterium]
GLAGAFGGGGGNQTLFGGRGATTFLTKATWILGGGFMLTSLILALAIGQRETSSRPRSVLRDNPPIEQQASPQPGGTVPGSAIPVEPAPGGAPAGGGN